jgi:hypothetical protein
MFLSALKIFSHWCLSCLPWDSGGLPAAHCMVHSKGQNEGRAVYMCVRNPLIAVSVLITGRQPPPYGIISERRSELAAQLLLREKSGAWRVGIDSNIPSLPVAQWYSYSGSWKWVTIMFILVGMVHLLSDICFCISSYVHQQLHSLDCQHFVHYISLVLFTFLRAPHGCRVSFLKETYSF